MAAAEVRMTEGPIAKQLISFAVPLLLGNLFQQLYNTADALIVGNLLGNSALAAVTGTGTVMPAPTAYALIVRVPTDDGDYDVALVRSSTTAPWLADEIQAVRDK